MTAPMRGLIGWTVLQLVGLMVLHVTCIEPLRRGRHSRQNSGCLTCGASCCNQGEKEAKTKPGLAAVSQHMLSCAAACTE